MLTAAFVTLWAGAASALVIDFSTGGGGAGGTVNTGGGNVTGSGIFINDVTITGAPVNNGVFNVDGAGVCADAIGGCGLLSFDRNANTISIVGSIPAQPGWIGPAISLQALLSGNLSGGVTVDVLGPGSITASGQDTKSRELLIALGLDPTTPFAFFGFVLTFNNAQGVPTAISTDIRNTAVPEPGSLALLGTGITAVAMSVRRRFGKKS